MAGVTKHSIESAPEHGAAQSTSQVSEELLSKLHPLEIKLLPHLKDQASIQELMRASGMIEVDVMRAVQWLETKDALKIHEAAKTELLLDANARVALEKEFPEIKILHAIKEAKSPINNVQEAAIAAHLTPEEMGASIGILRKKNLTTNTSPIVLTKEGEHAMTSYAPTLLLKKLHDQPQTTFENLSKEEQLVIAELQGRKNYLLKKEKKERTISLNTLGKQLAKLDTKHLQFADRLTVDDLQQGTWDKKYRAYDIAAPAPSINIGKEHFVQEAIEYVKSIWIEMGFTEMEGTMTQSAFWDLDALFVPQDHPARETQDTFYLDNPQSTTIPKALFERVRDTHENGGVTGSKGWRYKFSRAETEQMMLRTHTTALSAQTLLMIKEGIHTMPGKYFIVGKVFRNEALDWKHLFEFHQVEGIVVDPNVTFAQLIGYLKIFFAKMGFPEIRLRPHHFPYTEPSVEVDVWNPKKQQWIELGGAGVFRPEVTKTLLGEDVPVLAWGIGLERVIVEYFGLNDLRDLYRNDIEQLRTMPKFIKIEEANNKESNK